jgi:hypothetical protein
LFISVLSSRSSDQCVVLVTTHKELEWRDIIFYYMEHIVLQIWANDCNYCCWVLECIGSWAEPSQLASLYRAESSLITELAKWPSWAWLGSLFHRLVSIPNCNDTKCSGINWLQMPWFTLVFHLGCTKLEGCTDADAFCKVQDLHYQTKTRDESGLHNYFGCYNFVYR